MNLNKWRLKKKTKIKLKCFFTLFLALTMVVSLIPNVNIFANESYDYQYKYDNEVPGEAVWIADKSEYYTPYYYELKKIDTISGNISEPLHTYCADLYTDIGDGEYFSVMNLKDVDFYKEATDDNEEAKKYNEEAVKKLELY